MKLAEAIFAWYKRHSIHGYIPKILDQLNNACEDMLSVEEFTGRFRSINEGENYTRYLCREFNCFPFTKIAQLLEEEK